MGRVNPPAPLATGPIFRVTVFSRFQGSVANTTHDYMCNSFPANVRNAMIAFGEDWNGTVFETYRDTLSFQTDVFRILYSCISSFVIANVETLNLVQGTIAGNTLPNEMAAVCTRRGVLKGQHGRGRFSMPYVPIAFTGTGPNVNQLSNDGRTSYTALCNALQEPRTAGGSVVCNPVISTRPPKGAGIVILAERTTIQFPTLILGTIRRRKPGRGI